MDTIVRTFAEIVARGCEVASVALIALGAGGAVLRSAVKWRQFTDLAMKKEIFQRFAATIVLALEFALGADIADTLIAPTWEDIGQLAAIATIRTALNYFLERDLEATRSAEAQKARVAEA